MAIPMIILNGASSSGKTTLARHLQAELPDPWLAFSIDDFVEALPAKLNNTEGGIRISPDGTVSVGPDFRTLQAAWMAGIAAMVRAGANVIVDDVLLDGAAGQQRWRQALGDLPVLWVGIRCAAAVAAEREAQRGDRAPGMAALQADAVHDGMRYDLEVDTTHAGPADCARTIARAIADKITAQT